MKEQEHNMEAIDKLFKQSLEDYCPAPPPDVETALMQKYTLKPSIWNRLVNYLNLNTFLITTAVVVLIASVYYFVNRSIDKQSNLKTVKIISVSDSINHSDQQNDNSGILKNINKSVNTSIATANPSKSASQNTLINKNLQLKNNYSPVLNESVKKDVSVKEVKNTEGNAAGNRKDEIQNQELLSKSDNHVSVNSNNIPEAAADKPNIPDNTEKATEINAETGKNTGSNKELKPDLTDTNKNNTPSSEKTNKAKQKSVFGYDVALLPTFGGIFQKSRDVNMFYGGQINAGIIYKPITLGLESGLGYEKYTDRGGYEFTYQKTDTLGIIYDTTWLMQDSMWYPVVSTNYVTKQNYLTDVAETRLSYSYFIVPVYLSKQIYENKIFRVGIKSGVNVIFLSSKYEPVPTHNAALGMLTSEENKSYTRNNLVWQFVISPQILFHLNRRLYLQIEPTYRKFLNELYIGNYKPAGVPNPFSVNAGLRFEW